MEAAVSQTELFDSDPVFGTLTNFHYDSLDEDAFTIETVQDVEPVLELNKAQYNSVNERTQMGDVAHVARIPLVIWQDLVKRGIANDEARLKAWLNDPDNRFMRTRPGRV
jgi:hypothetical protein